MVDDARSRTCTGDELERLTSEGWVLRETRDEDRQEMGYPYSTNETVNGYTQYVNKTPPPVVVRRPVFILGRSRDEEMGKLRESLAHAEAEYKTSRECQATAEKACDEAIKMREATDALRARENEGHAAARERFAAVEAKARKLEDDIAKLRKEIGEGRFREILAS